MRIDSRFDDSSIVNAFKRLQALGQDTTPITRAIAAVLASESEDAFANESDPTTGKKWAPLTDNYKARLAKKGKTGNMLQRSQGGLAMSLSTEYDAVSAAIGTNKIYGPLHQWGGLSHMAPGPAAVPAREYMGLSQDGVADILTIINEQHARALRT
ncbi:MULTISPECIES: phage virion morphogenesis protein [Yersinia pseudotuberculosis complex]|uniref:phage virion morphogenesis protein n=1 Tax=Yersinia pseudotuberculosis complex TaxID=1649845 RepID=UPI0005DF393E|nr:MULTISPECIES: phage virion morphogenesis protein [Yersinia pseudotuberculosis complex]MBK1425927.1 phage virion morphogenesis protein [Yersinia pseudotuberculosis]MBK1426450.1 phage virion morphogenesis protein [Yersinia pseudotuberculosis]CNB77549.1 Mu-like prophage protein gpG [Yersinia pseudotuberculosis]CNC00567.1 Mu-like prophage protein gpG [Yersinia similis]CNF92800.1 Mu-like prophage protein gpG [Yersinia pseudotuberculosis]